MVNFLYFEKLVHILLKFALMGLAPSSLTLWVDRLKHDHVLAALTGCTTDSLPPLGSYFDFMDRLWTAPKSGRYSRNKLLPASWNSRKPEKPKGKKQKAQEARPKITEVIEKRLMDARGISFNFEQRLQLLFYHAAVLPSIEYGLIPKEHLTVSGDGTAVHTHSCPRGHHREDAPETLRHFSSPDASWGWDSDLEKFYFGYTLFQLSCYNSELKADIPLLLRFTSAKRHDSVSFLVAFHELEKHIPALPVENMCLDSAMDIKGYHLDIWQYHHKNYKGCQLRFPPYTPVRCGCSKRGENQYPQDIF